MDSKGDEANEEMLPNAPGSFGRNANLYEAIGGHLEVGFVIDTMFEVDTDLAMQPR